MTTEEKKHRINEILAQPKGAQKFALSASGAFQMDPEVTARELKELVPEDKLFSVVEELLAVYTVDPEEWTGILELGDDEVRSRSMCKYASKVVELFPRECTKLKSRVR